MLSPKYLADVPEAMVELYSQVESDILADMARRISTYDYYIPAAQYQLEKLKEMGALYADVTSRLSAMTGKTKQELNKLLSEAGGEALKADAEVYAQNGITVPKTSQAVKNIITAGAKQTLGGFKNLTATTAKTATRQFENALDRAWFQISSGAFDTNTAVARAVKDLSRQGVGAIRYPTGYVSTLEVAVRRAVVTGVNQTAAKAQWQLADELDCDLVEVTAHGGARPEHAAWQGQIYSRSGKSKKYKDFRSATGYGTGAGLCGWNCRHSFNPYFEGSPRTWTQEALDRLEEKSVSYNGERFTLHDAQQKQRHIESNIRRWKRENRAMQAAGLDTTESAAKIKQWQDTQKDFLRQTGLKRQSAREQIAGYGKSQAEKAAGQAKRTETIANSLFSLGSAEKNVNMYLKEKPIIDTLAANGVQYKRRISSKEIIVDAGTPKITSMRQHATYNLSNKLDRKEMTIEMAQTFVDTSKLVLYNSDKETLKFMAENGYAVLNFGSELVTAVPQKWRKKYDQYLWR